MSAKVAVENETVRYVCEELTKPLPIYSHATIHNGVAHISAVQGFIPGTFTFPEGGVAAEAEQMLQNLSKILKGIGSGFDKILKMTLYFIDMEKDFLATNDVVNRYIPDHGPARSSIGVAALPRNARVVVDCAVVVHRAAVVDPASRSSKETNMSTETYDVGLINDLDGEAFAQKLSRISSSKTWNLEMRKRRPFATVAALLDAASDVWWNVCTKEDWIESFNGRPIIGDQESFVKDRWCYLEDEHVIDTAKDVADELVRCNEPYMSKFGYVWILLCEGLTPDQQLTNYKRRIENDPRTELVENCVEEFKIIQRRLRLCLLNQDPYDRQL
jgi:2-iminobutanoate/2-iminopropanoate deaminase